MRLTRVEREKITDSVLNIQSARASLEDMDESKVPELPGIQECLEDADRNLSSALRDSPLKKNS
jgi:hypothetical protein